MNNWKKTILRQTDTMDMAVKALNQESLRIVMVVDDDERLIGSITDGDIRRGLIRKLPMNTAIAEFMHKNPIVMLVGGNKSQMLAKMKELDLLQLPIVDSDGRIVGLETLQSLIEKKKFNNPVFLMAGGFGKRLAPLTNNTPKPLLKVGNKPILENVINQFIDAGFYNFYISTHYRAEMVQEYFGDGSNLNVSIKYIYENAPLGTAGSLGLLPDNLPKLPILMMNGDLLTNVDLKELLRFHLQEGEDVTMCVREYDFQVPYGVVETNGKHVISIEEKPVHHFFVNAGIYVLNPSILDMVDGKSCIDMPQLLKQKMRESGKISMFPVHEYWLDIGQIKEFDQAQIDVSQF
jgi:dTDP-glucose pyrophosphorylase